MNDYQLMMTIYMIGGHAVCDYPLQGDFLARGKNHKSPIPGIPWYQCLFAHAAIHGTMVTIVTGSTALGCAEYLAHALIDYGKCDERYGFNADQLLHLACKALWLALAWNGIA